MIGARLAAPLAAPLAALLMAGCLASKGDVAQLRTQLQSMQTAASTADAEQRAHVDQVLAQIVRSNDSVRILSLRLAKLQSEVQTDHHEMGRQILQIQELSGQSQRRLQELRASLEERSQSQQPAPGDTLGAAPAPGPGLLFQSSLDQLRRGSARVARDGFEQLLRNYPSYEDAPEAMVYIAETYASERNQVAADSVYQLVVQRYPRSPKAATALYKRALSLKAAGQGTAARAAFDRIVRDFPRSDEASLAREQIRSINR